MPIRAPLSSNSFDSGFNSTLFLAPDRLTSAGEPYSYEQSVLSYFAPGSRNLLGVANQIRPWRGMDLIGDGGNQMFQVGATWGSLQNTAFVNGKGSFFQDAARSLWFIGAGVPALETSPIAVGVEASTTLKVSIAVAGVYDVTTTYDAGLPQSSAPDVGIISVPGVGYTGLLAGPVAFKIARLRLTTGARSIASPSSAVISPVNQTVRLTFPLPADGQDYWAVFGNQPGFGGVGLYYRVAYGVGPSAVLDIPESVVAAGVVDGIARSLEFDYVAGDLIPEVAYIDDYPPPAGTQAVRLENVMCVLGAYGDSTDPVTSTDSGTVGAISLPNFYESYKPRYLVYFPEPVVDVLSRPTDSYAYVAHRNSITAMQYVGILDGPAVQVNTIWPDIGIAFPHNWCQVHGLIYAFVARGGIVRMTPDGAPDFAFAASVREFTQDWELEDTKVSWHPDTMNVVWMNGREGVTFNLQNQRFWPPYYLADAGIPGTAVSCVNSQGKMIVTLQDGDDQTAYFWDEGATKMPITSVTNWSRHSMAASIEEVMAAVDTDRIDDPLIISIHRNIRKVFARDGATTSSDATLTSATYGFDTSLEGYMGCVYGEDVGGSGVDYLIFVIGTVTNSTTIEMVDENGDPLLAQATLTDCYFTIAYEVRTYDWLNGGAPARVGPQQIPPLQQFYTTDAMSHCVGLTMLTSAQEGRIYNVQTSGTGSGIPASKTS